MAIVPVITANSSLTGFTPLTVYFSALNSNFGGVNPADCIFLWDMGDTGPTFGYVAGQKHWDNNEPHTFIPFAEVGTVGATSAYYSTDFNYKNRARWPDPRLDTFNDNSGYLNRSATLYNKQYGPSVAYTFYHNNTSLNKPGNAGNFPINLTIFYGGTGFTATAINVTATNPIFYSDFGRTASQTGPNDFAVLNINTTYTNTSINQNNPASATSQKFANIFNAMQWVDTWRPNGKVKICTTNISGQLSLTFPQPLVISKNNIIITPGSLGSIYQFSFTPTNALAASSGPKDLIQITGNAKNIYIENFYFKYNSGITAFDYYKNNINGIYIASGQNITVCDCLFGGMNKSIYSDSNSATAGQIHILGNRFGDPSYGNQLGRYKGSCIDLTLKGTSSDTQASIVANTFKKGDSSSNVSIVDTSQDIISIKGGNGINIQYNSAVYGGAKTYNALNYAISITGTYIPGELCNVIGVTQTNSVSHLWAFNNTIIYSNPASSTLVYSSLTGVTSGSFTAGMTAYWFVNGSTLTSSFSSVIGSFTGTVAGPTGTIYLYNYSGTLTKGATGYFSLVVTGSTRYLVLPSPGITTETHTGFPRFMNIRGASSGAVLFTTTNPELVTYSNILSITGATGVYVGQNKFYHGTNTFNNNDQLRIDGNCFVSGQGALKYTQNNTTYYTKPKSCITLYSASNASVYNNVFDVGDSNTNFYCGAIALDGLTGITHTNLKIINNTFRSLGFMSMKTGIVNLTTPYGSGITQCAIRNNLFLDLFLTNINNFYNYDSTDIGGLTFYNNYYPIRRNTLNYAIKDSTTGLSFNTWKTTMEPSGSTHGFSIVEFIESNGFAPCITGNNILDYGVSLTDQNNYGIYHDYNLIPRRNTTTPGCAATEQGLSGGLIYPNVNSSPFDFTFTTPLLIGGRTNSGASAYSFSLGIADSTYKTSGPLGTTSSAFLVAPGITNYYSNGSVASNSMLYATGVTGFGGYIYTTVSAITGPDYINISILYTNDGPADQALTGNHNKLGSIIIDHLNFGGGFEYLLDQSSSGFSSYDYLIGTGLNTTNSALSYPGGTKYTPISIIRNNRYTLSVSRLYDSINSGKVFQEIYTNNIRQSSPTTHRLYTTFIDNSSNPSAQYLTAGCTFGITLALKITREPRRWVDTCSIYKDYFRTTYGDITYAKDPRPIAYQVMADPAYGATFGYNPNVSNPMFNGFTGWKQFAINAKDLYNYDRLLMWAPGGVNLVNTNQNYPQLCTSPLFRGITPHSNYPLLSSTKVRLREASAELPDFNFYNGYTVFVPTNHPAWDVAAPAGLTIDMSETRYSQAIFDESDTQINYFGCKMFSFDLAPATSVKNHYNVIDALTQRYRDVDFFVELGLCDVYARTARVYDKNNQGNSIGMAGPHYLSDYITPGAEHDYVIFYEPENFTDLNTRDGVLHAYERLAVYGQNGAEYSPQTMSLSGENLQIYQSRDRRYDFVDIPSEYTVTGAPATPSNIIYGFRNEPLHVTFGVTETCVAIKWDSVTGTDPDLSYYIVYKSKIQNGSSSISGPFVKKRLTKNTYFYDNLADINNTYYYKISAVDVFGNESALSDILAITFPPESSLHQLSVTGTAQALSVNTGIINISWT